MDMYFAEFLLAKLRSSRIKFSWFNKRIDTANPLPQEALERSSISTALSSASKSYPVLDLTRANRSAWHQVRGKLQLPLRLNFCGCPLHLHLHSSEGCWATFPATRISDADAFWICTARGLARIELIKC